MSLEESGFEFVEGAEPVFTRPRRLRPANWNQMSLAERGLHDPDAPIVALPTSPDDVFVELPVARLNLEQLV